LSWDLLLLSTGCSGFVSFCDASLDEGGSGGNGEYFGLICNLLDCSFCWGCCCCLTTALGDTRDGTAVRDAAIGLTFNKMDLLVRLEELCMLRLSLNFWAILSRLAAVSSRLRLRLACSRAFLPPPHIEAEVELKSKGKTNQSTDIPLIGGCTSFKTQLNSRT